MRFGFAVVPKSLFRATGETAELLAEKIFREVESELGQDWWR